MIELNVTALTRLTRAHEATRQALLPNLSRREPAARYPVTV